MSIVLPTTPTRKDHEKVAPHHHPPYIIMAEGAELKSENWVMVVSEQHRYQGVSYKSDIIVISGIFYLFLFISARPKMTLNDLKSL